MPVLIEPNHVVTQGPIPDINLTMYVEAMIEAAYLMHAKNPGKWTIHYPDALKLQGTRIAEMYTAKVELVNCLPTAAAGVPLQRILEFKQKRYDELLGLRVSLDDMYSKIAYTNDIPHTKTSEIQRLENALLDLKKSDDHQILNWLVPERSTNVGVTVSEVMGGAAAGIAAASVFFSSPLALLAGAVAGATASERFSGFRFNISRTRQLNHTGGLDLSYITALRNEPARILEPDPK